MTDERSWPRIDWEDLVGPEWAAWYAMTPQERCRESQKLWETFVAAGGSLDPHPGPQSPFYDPDERRPTADESWPDEAISRQTIKAFVERRRP